MLTIPILFNPYRLNSDREEDFYFGLYLVMAVILGKLHKSKTLYLHHSFGNSILPKCGLNWRSSF